MLSVDRDLTAEEFGELALVFHTVKGGSGFFSLPKLSRVAGELETLFKSGAADAGGAEPATTVQEARALIEELGKMAAALPPLEDTIENLK